MEAHHKSLFTCFLFEGELSHFSRHEVPVEGGVQMLEWTGMDYWNGLKNQIPWVNSPPTTRLGMQFQPG